MGDQCDQDCASQTFRQDCAEICSQYGLRPTIIKISACDPVNGTCLFGCVNGYVEPLCLAPSQDTSSESSSDSILGIGIGIGVGAMVVIGVVSVGIYCYWKRSHNTRSRRQRPPGYEETDLSRQDDHTYRELYKGADDYNLPTDAFSEGVNPSTTTTEYIQHNNSAYENVDINPDETIPGETSMGEPDGGYVNQRKEISGDENGDGGYANCALKIN